MENNINGYVIYPASIGKMDPDAAREFAAEQSHLPENGYYSRVEDCDTEKTIAEYRDGVEQ